MGCSAVFRPVFSLVLFGPLDLSFKLGSGIGNGFVVEVREVLMVGSGPPSCHLVSPTRAATVLRRALHLTCSSSSRWFLLVCYIALTRLHCPIFETRDFHFPASYCGTESTIYVNGSAPENLCTTQRRNRFIPKDPTTGSANLFLGCPNVTVRTG